MLKESIPESRKKEIFLIKKFLEALIEGKPIRLPKELLPGKDLSNSLPITVNKKKTIKQVQSEITLNLNNVRELERAERIKWEKQRRR